MAVEPEQIKAARAVLGLGVRELASMATIAPFTIHRFETRKGNMHPNNLAKVQAVIEGAGVTFLPDHGEGPGIRWRAEERLPARHGVEEAK